MDVQSLIPRAWTARSRAYAPYSQFAVGAALVTRDGKVFTGCNVENISFGLTCCAERNAVFAAVAAGELDFVGIVIVADSSEPVTPCGACRQVLAEFGDDLEVVSTNSAGLEHRTTIRDLLPRAKAGIMDQRST